MTIFYPDISSAQGGVSTKGASAICVKATEGTNYTNPDYKRAMNDANAHGVFNFAYHFMHAGNAGAQARYCHSVVNKTPLMLDVEPSTLGGNPTVADAEAFVEAFRNAGGVIHLVYLPRWWWQELGSPSLSGLKSRGLRIVSSAYPTNGYSEHGTGWDAYGGMTPTVWQYTASGRFNGEQVDLNAFKGTVAELESIVRTGKMPPKPPPGPQRHQIGRTNTNSLWDIAKARGTTVAHLEETSKAHEDGGHVAILNAYLALGRALHDKKLPYPAMPEGFVYWTSQ